MTGISLADAGLARSCNFLRSGGAGSCAIRSGTGGIRADSPLPRRNHALSRPQTVGSVSPVAATSEKRTVQNFVGGELVDAVDGRTTDLIDPSTGEVFGSAPV